MSLHQEFQFAADKIVSLKEFKAKMDELRDQQFTPAEKLKFKLSRPLATLKALFFIADFLRSPGLMKHSLNSELYLRGDLLNSAALFTSNAKHSEINAQAFRGCRDQVDLMPLLKQILK